MRLKTYLSLPIGLALLAALLGGCSGSKSKTVLAFERDKLVYLHWTETGDEFSGSAQFVSRIGSDVDSETLPIEGRRSGSNLSLVVGPDSDQQSWSGSIKGSKLTIEAPSPAGGFDETIKRNGGTTFQMTFPTES